MKKYNIIYLIILSLVMASCSQVDPDTLKEQEVIDKEINLTVWGVYWDVEAAANEIRYISEHIANISYFAAYFNPDNTVFIPEHISTLLSSSRNTLKNKAILHYLSVVNDKINSDGTSALKDKELLYQLLADKKSRVQHIDELIRLTQENRYDGIEIDYEGIKKDEDLWGFFLDFVSELYAKASDNRLKMRVILEPSAPVDKLDFPEGPEYVVMCYNLYGTHSGPGPKADIEFLKGLSERMRMLPGEVNFALATGGFEWDDKGNVRAVTEEKAVELMQLYDAEATRDKESHSMVFNYVDSDNVQHEVWFADEVTLTEWIKLLRNKKHKKFSLWRLGGNMDSTLKALEALEGF